MELITTTVFPNSSASIFEVKQLSIDITSRLVKLSLGIALLAGNISDHNLILFSEEVTILVTVRRHDIDFELSAIHRQLRSALLQILRIQTVIISRFGNIDIVQVEYN